MAHTALTSGTRFKYLSACLLICLCLFGGNTASAYADGVCSVPNFSAPTLFNSGFARAIVVADFTGDGIPDVIAGNNTFGGGYSIFIGDGSGFFPTRGSTVNVGSSIMSVAAGDFNGNGALDLVTANGESFRGNASVDFDVASCCNDNLNIAWPGASGDSITTSVAAADFNADGKMDVVVTDRTFNAVYVALGVGDGTFNNKRTFNSGGAQPVYVKVGDFDGDGKLDLAVANSTSSPGNVAILLGDGAGGFGTPAPYAVGTNPASIATGDFNGDGRIDLAVANNGSNNISILPGTGAGAFGAATNLSSGGTLPGGIAAADFNGDAKVDLVVVNSGEGNALFLTGDGAGNFTPAVSRQTGGSDPKSVAVTDLNGDGRSDLVFGHEASRRISVMLNDCGATPAPTSIKFSTSQIFHLESAPESIATINVVRDGALAGTATVNYATTNGTATAPADYTSVSGTLSFAPGETSKSFTVPVVNDSLNEPHETINLSLSGVIGDAVLGSPAAATLTIGNDDPVPTLSVSDASLTEGNAGAHDATFNVTLSSPSGFTVAVNYATADFSAIAGADYASASGGLTFAPGETTKTVAVSVNGDTLSEVNESFFVNLSGATNATIADAQGAGTILEDDAACPNPTFTAAANVDSPSPVALISADFNRDGKPDLAAADVVSGSVKVRLGDGAGAFGAAASFPVGPEPRSMALGDFNLDGKTDLAVSRSAVSGAVGAIAILLGDGAGGFAPATQVNLGSQSYVVVVVDLNLDGKPDLVVLSDDTGGVGVYLGDGQGGFTPPGLFSAVYNNPLGAVVGDFNADGKPDVAVSNKNSNNVAVLLGNGTGSFGGMLTLPVGARPRGIAAGDFNGDGRPDLVVANIEDNNISLLLADGAGNFVAARNFITGVRPESITVADFNSDGRLDVATANFQSSDSTPGDVSVLFGTGAGHFTLPTNFPVGRGAIAVIASDFNGDARSDLVVANLTTQNLSVLLNGCASTPAPVSTLQFDQASLQYNEGDGRATFNVTRTGDTSGTATVAYRTADSDAFTLSCADTGNHSGGAFARCDFSTTVGTLQFNSGETTKTVTVPIIDDGHDEGAETFQLSLSNVSGATLGSAHTATVTIQDNDAAGAPNPVMSSNQFFVRQQYLDFLSREPDAGGFDAWLNVLNNCANIFNGPNVPSGCDRIFVSGEGFFRSQEFQLKGLYVFRFYKLAFNRLPEYLEVVSDMSFVAGQTTEEVYARKAQLATLIAERGEFQTAYAAMTNAQYVNTLLGRYQLAEVTTPDPAQPDGTLKVTLTGAELTNRLNAGTLSRAQVLRAVADSDAVGAREFNNAFVGMQYYGYLRRKPDQDGFNAWLRVLQAGDVRTMVDGFLNSVEYKLRFGQS